MSGITTKKPKAGVGSRAAGSSGGATKDKGDTLSIGTRVVVDGKLSGKLRYWGNVSARQSMPICACEAPCLLGSALRTYAR